MSDEEEMVAVDLDDDYYTGPYVSSHDGYPKDYLVTRSQLERWQAAEAAWEAAQSEIEQTMREQRERVRALRAQRPKSQVFQWAQNIYGPLLQAQLEQGAKLSEALRREGE